MRVPVAGKENWMSPFGLVGLRRIGLFAASFFLLSSLAVGDEAGPPPAARPESSQRKVEAKLPPSFEPNLGQTDPRVRFLSRGRGYTLFLTENEAVLAVRRPEVGSQKSKDIRRPTPVVRGQLPLAQNSRFKVQNSAAYPLLPSSSQLLVGSTQASPGSESAVQATLRLRLLGANAASKVVGLDELPGKSHYLHGNDPTKWRTNVPTYARVQYEDIYSGVDLVYYGKPGGELEYDFVVAPGADPRAIRLGMEVDQPRNSGQRAAGRAQYKIRNRNSRMASRLHIAPNGDLVVAMPRGELRFHKPVVYQMESTVESRLSEASKGGRVRWAGDGRQPVEPKLAGDGSRSEIQDPIPTWAASPESEDQNRKLVDAQYVLASDGGVSFKIAPYDRSLPLIIDPVLSYSTYLGGSDMDYANGIAVDSHGNAYVTGYTASVDFPVANAAQSSPAAAPVQKMARQPLVLMLSYRS